MTAKDCVPIYLLISYYALCNDYGVLHEHEQYEDNSDPLDYDNYADTDQMFQEMQIQIRCSKKDRKLSQIDNGDRSLFTEDRSLFINMREQLPDSVPDKSKTAQTFANRFSSLFTSMQIDQKRQNDKPS